MMIRSLVLFVSLLSARLSSAFVHSPTLSRTRKLRTCTYSAASPPSGAISTSPEKPIVVIGATGKTGRIITKLLADQYHHVRAVTRTEKVLDNITPSESKYVSYAVGDVRNYNAILEVLKRGAAGVIWAATSSGVKKGGGDAADVDYKGAYHVAKACLECKVPKLAFLSAACVTHPNAPGSKAVNFLTKFTYGDTPWIDAKIAGEEAVREQYKNSKKKNAAYVIVRGAAPLVNKPPVPVQDVMVLQGDLYSSGESISRVNVARMVVAALLKGKATDFTTFEVCPATRLYKNDEANFLDLAGLPSLHQTDRPDLPKELVHKNADSYEELLDGLLTDKQMEKYKTIVTGYRGQGVPPIKEDTIRSNPALQS